MGIPWTHRPFRRQDPHLEAGVQLSGLVSFSYLMGHTGHFGERIHILKHTQASQLVNLTHKTNSQKLVPPPFFCPHIGAHPGVAARQHDTNSQKSVPVYLLYNLTAEKFSKVSALVYLLDKSHKVTMWRALLYQCFKTN